MISRSLRLSLIAGSTLLAGAFVAPAFGQSYGAMPRGACMSKQTHVSSTPARVYQQPVYDAGDSAAPVRQTQRTRRAKGFGSPF
jgi:hypothetical protein